MPMYALIIKILQLWIRRPKPGYFLLIEIIAFTLSPLPAIQ